MRSFLPSWTALALAVLPACNRAPQEPAPAASTRAQEIVIPPPAPGEANRASSAATPVKALRGGRCILPTPDAPPPPVSPGPAANCPPDPEGPAPMPSIRISAPEATRGATAISAELARGSHDLERGLMFRRTMGDDRGMFFDLVDRRDHGFWMHNTCIPLDLLFVDDDGLIVGIVENAPTMNDDPRSVQCPSTHVLEVNAGWSRRHGVRAGQHLEWPRD